MTSRIAACLLLATGLATPVFAQTIKTETDVTVGASTEDISAAAAQLRLFGTLAADWRVFGELTWGTVSRPGSDVFGSVYPYDRRVRPMEAYVERVFRPSSNTILGVKSGRYRTPFGISGRSEHGYNGFIRPPLIRYGRNWALSNNFMEAGADILVGHPSLSFEASLGTPSDEGPDPRPRGLDTLVRTQGYYRSLIAGASYIRTQPSMVGRFVTGRMTFSGLDLRWMRNGVLLRSEWVAGRPFATVKTRGGYLDVIVHRTAMGPVTVVGRIERLDYFAGAFSDFFRRGTIGARVRLSPMLAAQINVIHQPHGLSETHRTALDVGLTFSRRF